MHLLYIPFQHHLSHFNVALFFPLVILGPMADYTGSGPSSIPGSYRARKAREFRPLWTAQSPLRQSPRDE
jgi:hypothetical protein